MIARKTEFYIEGLSAYRAVDKLAREGIAVLSAEKVQKNAIRIQLYAKDAKKGFAILKHSCYNVKKITPVGLSRWLARCVRSAGLLLGALGFALFVLGMQSRVLDIRVVGSGAYYESEVMRILSEKGVKRLGAAPKQSAIESEILSLPRVNFCSLSSRGGVLYVTVEVSDEYAPLSKEPLLAPATGTVEELTAVRGTPLVKAGDSVRKGDICVKGVMLVGEEERPAAVIAYIKVSFPFSAEYACESEEKARAQAALDYGEGAEFTVTKTETGYLAEGKAYAEASVNIG